MLNEILRQSVLAFLWIGSAVGILVGIGLLFRPQQVGQLNHYLSRWVGSSRLNKVLDRPRWIDRFFYRHHRLLGTAVFVGAMAVLYIFLFQYNFRRISALIPRNYWWLSDALIGMLLIGSVVAVLVGFIVLIRPSLLRDIEKSANRWISTEHLHVQFNAMHFSVEKSLLRHHRLAGVAILLGSLYIIVVLGHFLLRWSGKL